MELYADVRYVAETTSPRDICLWAGLSVVYCTHEYSKSSIGGIVTKRAVQTSPSKKVFVASTSSPWEARSHGSRMRIKINRRREHRRRLSAGVEGSAGWPADKFNTPLVDYQNSERLRRIKEKSLERLRMVDQNAVMQSIAGNLDHRDITWDDMDREDRVLANKVNF